jgi:hypothetical protein
MRSSSTGKLGELSEEILAVTTEPQRGSVSRFLLSRRFLLALLFVGVVLRVVQYAADTSMWFDEFSIARNIVHRSASQLAFEPLGYNQVAPVGFMLLEKLISVSIGSSDLALRLLLFLCGLAALPLFLILAERLLDGYAVPFAVAAFAIGVPFIRYTTELKQYGVDVAAALALSLIALRLRDPDSSAKRCIAAGLAGAILVWFSQTAVFVMAGLAAALLLDWLVERRAQTRRAVLTTVPIWALASVAATVASMRRMTPETQKFMHDFWQGRHGFFPWPLKNASDLFWLWEQVTELFRAPVLRYRWPALYSVLAIAGLVALWRRNRFGAWLLLGPFSITVLAAVVQQYPIRTRVVLFLVPSLVLLVAQGAEWIRRIAGRLRPAFGGAFMVALFIPPIWTVVEKPPPYWTEDYKSMLSFVQANRRSDDAMYVYVYAYEALERYGKKYGIEQGDYVLGGCWRDDFRAYLRDVDRYRGASRLWVITSGVPEFVEPGQSIRRYLGAIGTLKQSKSVPSRSQEFAPVTADLYDLSDPTRLSSASASTFPLKAPGDRRPLCLDFVRPDR